MIDWVNPEQAIMVLPNAYFLATGVGSLRLAACVIIISGPDEPPRVLRRLSCLSQAARADSPACV